MDVRSRFAKPLRRGAPRPAFAALATILLVPRQGHAAILRACRPSDSVLLCRLESLLTLLYAAAAILGLLLIGAVVAAVRAYKRKGRKINPRRGHA